MRYDFLNKDSYDTPQCGTQEEYAFLHKSTEISILKNAPRGK